MDTRMAQHSSARCRLQRRDDRAKVVGRLALERQPLAGPGMQEAERSRVQHRTPRLDPWPGVVAHVDAFADQRMTELCEVNPDLVLPPRFETAFDERGPGKRGQRPDFR